MDSKINTIASTAPLRPAAVQSSSCVFLFKCLWWMLAIIANLC